jgi:prenylcysteine oxidase/farnesylcysteine lyase
LYKKEDGFKDGIPLFQTFSVHRILENGESVIKIFSPHKLEENELDLLFLNRSWTYNKGWHAFPELDPVTKDSEFPPFILKANEQDESGIIYTSAFENFISVRLTFLKYEFKKSTKASIIDYGNTDHCW